MDIIVEDGTGIVIANSYLSTDEADDLLSINIHSTWATLVDDDKEKLLMYATRVLDERCRWNGVKTFPTSGLAWPRMRVRDKEGNLVEDNIVPLAVKYATAVLANHLITNNPEVANTSANLTQIEVDVIRIKFDVYKATEKYPDEIKFILDGLGTFRSGKRTTGRIQKC
jgi:hypothetical protein